MTGLLFQTTTTTATTIDGAFVVLILAVSTGVPILINGFLLPLGKALITRINTNTDQKIQELGVFKLLQEEVKRLQSAHIEDEATMAKMQAQILELQEGRFKDKLQLGEKDNEILRLQNALQDCIEEKTNLTKL